MDFFKNFVYHFYNLPEESYTKLEALFSIKEFKKGDIILDLNEVQENVYILQKGIVRSYIIDNEGKEHTKALIFTTHLVGNTDSILNEKPSDQVYQCLSDCFMIYCNFKAFDELSLQDHYITIFNSRILEAYYINQENLIVDLCTLTPYERYEKLVQRFPDLNQYVNQYHIASYLNITPVQFSRLKKKHLNSKS